MKPNQKKYLGIYWGKETIEFVESEGHNISKMFSIAIPSGSEPNPNQVTFVPVEMRITAAIQRAVYENKINNATAYLSLPTKDTILRSFTIPWMQPSEVKQVVEFEAIKYIPFKLEDLAYTFHPITVTENKKKSIRIIFVSARKDLIEGNKNILENAGLKLQYIESAAFSLVRLLTSKKLIAKNHTYAVLEIENNEGKIIVIDQGLPNFARELHVSQNLADVSDENKEIIKARLYNEIRISLDYFARQHNNQKIDKIIHVVSDQTRNLLENIESELNISTHTISPQNILNTNVAGNLGQLNSYGIGLRNIFAQKTNFDLSPAKSMADFTAVQSLIFDFKIIAATAFLCLIVLAASFLFSSQVVVNYEDKVKLLMNNVDKYEGVAITDITKQMSETEIKFDSYKAIPIKSELAFFLARIPYHLPEGAWLNNFRVELQKGTDIGKHPVVISLTGFVYRVEAEQEIRVVNKFVANLKEDTEFSNYFKNINLGSVTSQQLGGHAVIAFNVTCN